MPEDVLGDPLLLLWLLCPSRLMDAFGEPAASSMDTGMDMSLSTSSKSELIPSKRAVQSMS